MSEERGKQLAMDEPPTRPGTDLGDVASAIVTLAVFLGGAVGANYVLGGLPTYVVVGAGIGIAYSLGVAFLSPPERMSDYALGAPVLSLVVTGVVFGGTLGALAGWLLVGIVWPVVNCPAEASWWPPACLSW